MRGGRASRLVSESLGVVFVERLPAKYILSVQSSTLSVKRAPAH